MIDNSGGPSTSGRNLKHWISTALAGGEVDCVSITRHHELFHLLIKTACNLTAGSARSVVAHQTPAVSFKSCSCLGTINNRTAIFGVDRSRVVTTIAVCDVSRCAARERNDVDVAIGGGCFYLVRVFYKSEFFAVRREGEVNV